MSVYYCAACDYLRCAIVDNGQPLPRNEGGCHKFDGRDADWREVVDPGFADALRAIVPPAGGTDHHPPSCPRCGAPGIRIGETPLPDGNGSYDQFRCSCCEHGYMTRARDHRWSNLAKSVTGETP